MKRNFDLSCSDENYEMVKACAKAHGISMGELFGELIDCLAGEGNCHDARFFAKKWYQRELEHYETK